MGKLRCKLVIFQQTKIIPRNPSFIRVLNLGSSPRHQFLFNCYCPLVPVIQLLQGAVGIGLESFTPCFKDVDDFQLAVV